MSRAYYSASIHEFLNQQPTDVLGRLLQASEFPVELSQRFAWEEEIRILRDVLQPYAGAGKVYFEYSIPRLGKRIDVVATALHARMSVEQMTHLDLSYAPPFGPVWDPVLVAARKAAGVIASDA